MGYRSNPVLLRLGVNSSRSSNSFVKYDYSLEYLKHLQVYNYLNQLFRRNFFLARVALFSHIAFLKFNTRYVINLYILDKRYNTVRSVKLFWRLSRGRDASVRKSKNILEWKPWKRRIIFNTKVLVKRKKLASLIYLYVKYILPFTSLQNTLVGRSNSLMASYFVGKIADRGNMVSILDKLMRFNPKLLIYSRVYRRLLLGLKNYIVSVISFIKLLHIIAESNKTSISYEHNYNLYRIRRCFKLLKYKLPNNLSKLGKTRKKIQKRRSRLKNRYLSNFQLIYHKTPVPVSSYIYRLQKNIRKYRKQTKVWKNVRRLKWVGLSKRFAIRSRRRFRRLSLRKLFKKGASRLKRKYKFLRRIRRRTVGWRVINRSKRRRMRWKLLYRSIIRNSRRGRLFKKIRQSKRQFKRRKGRIKYFRFRKIFRYRYYFNIINDLMVKYQRRVLHRYFIRPRRPRRRLFRSKAKVYWKLYKKRLRKKYKKFKLLLKYRKFIKKYNLRYRYNKHTRYKKYNRYTIYPRYNKVNRYKKWYRPGYKHYQRFGRYRRHRWKGFRRVKVRPIIPIFRFKRRRRRRKIKLYKKYKLRAIKHGRCLVNSVSGSIGVSNKYKLFNYKKNYLKILLRKRQRKILKKRFRRRLLKRIKFNKLRRIRLILRSNTFNKVKGNFVKFEFESTLGNNIKGKSLFSHNMASHAFFVPHVSNILLDLYHYSTLLRYNCLNIFSTLCVRYLMPLYQISIFYTMLFEFFKKIWYFQLSTVLLKDLYKISGQSIILNIIRVKQGCYHPELVTKFIVFRLLNQYRFGEIVFPILRELSLNRIKNKIKGIMIVCSGRLTRRQRATRRGFVLHKIALGKLNSKILYSFKTVQLRYGMSGIKLYMSYGTNK